jgi:seryl-tRNA synthetase
MHDIKWIRENADAFDAALKRRGLEPLSRELLAIDENRRTAITYLERALARRNAASREIGEAKKKKDDAHAEDLMIEVTQLKAAIVELQKTPRELEGRLNGMLAEIPNLPLDDVPDGVDEHGNVQRHVFGTVRNYAFTPKPHDDLGSALGFMDFEAAAKLSGARFVVLKKGLARLERAIGQFMLDLHTNEHGYTEVNPPLMVRDDVMFGTAQLPKFRDDQFGTKRPIDISDAAEKLAKNYRSNDPSIDARLAKTIIEKLLIEGIASDDELFKGQSLDERKKFTDYVWLNLHEIWRQIQGDYVNLWLIPPPACARLFCPVLRSSAASAIHS